MTTPTPMTWLTPIPPPPGSPAEIRMLRLRELGLDLTPSEVLDSFATRLAQEAGLPYAMVNLITDATQNFPGLHTPPADAGLPMIGRTMTLDEGYCPGLLVRRGALVLNDVYAAPRFAGNPVVDQVGIRCYYGAPLIDEDTGIPIGTVCTVGVRVQPEETDQAMLALIKAHRDEVQSYLMSHARGRR